MLVLNVLHSARGSRNMGYAMKNGETRSAA